MIEWIAKTVNIPEPVQIKIFISAMIIIGIIIIRYLLVRFLISQLSDLNQRYQWRKISLYLAVLAVFACFIPTWLGILESVGTIIGLVSAGLAIALKDPIMNIAGWVFILFRQPFRIGDRIQIGDVTGDVIDIRLFQFSLSEIGNWVDADQSTGRIIHMPNGIVFTQPQANYNWGFYHVWHEIPILLTFESDWKRAKAILTKIVNDHALEITDTAEKQIKAAAKKFRIHYTSLVPEVFTTVKDSGVLLTMRFLCDPLKRRSDEQEIMENVLEEFAKYDNIDFAYPTTRFYDNLGEGKFGTKPKAK